MKVIETRYIQGKPIIETDFAEFDGCVLELARDTKSKLVLVKYEGEGTNCQASAHFIHEDHALVPPPEDEFTRHMRFARKLVYCESVSELLQRIIELVGKCIDLDDRRRFLLACFVLNTWVIDRVRVAPYVSLVGLPQSGKSTALAVLHLLCRRGLMTADISTASFHRACQRLSPTLFIDETATSSQKNALFHLLRSGTTRDVVTFRGGHSFHSFSAKVMAWRELPDDEALNSRCLLIPMCETTRLDLAKVNDPEIIEAANTIQGQLMYYRFKHRQPLTLPEVPRTGSLRSRYRDIFESLALGISEDSEACTRLLEYFLEEQDNGREPLPSRETAVIGGLFLEIHRAPNKESYLIQNIADCANVNLNSANERFKLNAKSVSNIMMTLGFRNRRRTNKGFVASIDRAARVRIHDLMKTYSIVDRDSYVPFLDDGDEACDICEHDACVHGDEAPVEPAIAVEDVQVGSVADNPPAIVGELGELGEHGELGEPEIDTEPLRFSNRFIENEEDRKLIADLQRDPPAEYVEPPYQG